MLINIPAKIFLTRSILSGAFPFTNPYLFSGSSFLADINLSPLYPGNVFFFLFEPFTALTVSNLFHIALAGIGMYWVARLWGLRQTAALLPSIIFAFSGTMITYTNNLPMMQVAAILPWLFGSWMLFCERQSFHRWVFVVFFSVLQIYAGHIQLTYYSFLLCFGYALLFMNRSLSQRLVMLGFIAMAIGVFAGPQLAPFLNLARHSTRIGMGESYATFGALPISALIRFILPSSVGNLSQGTDWWQGGSMYGYVGILPFVLVLFFLRNMTRRDIFLLIVSVVSFLGSFGSSTPVFPLMSSIVPGLGLFRAPSHLLFIMTFCFSLIAGIAVDQRRLRHQIFFWGSMSMVVLSLVVDYVKTHVDFFLNALNVQKLEAKMKFLGDIGVERILLEIQHNLLFIAMSFFLLYFWLKYMKRGRVLIMLAIVCVDMFLYS
ncbi:MAG: hypothetical protein N3A54_06535, partial [Patescibacteria group bacterium]|nr:hypothetical protein [Patescibacteria group bacterium]